MQTAIALCHQEDELKQREADQQKRAPKRAQLQKDIQVEEEKLEQFNKWVDAWERAELLRRFIAAYQDKSLPWGAQNQAEHEAWIEWATRQADRIDPFFSKKPESILDRKHEFDYRPGYYENGPKITELSTFAANYPSFGRGFDSHRPLQKSAKFILIRRALLTGLPSICAQKAGFCAQIAPQFRALVRLAFLKFRRRKPYALMVKTGNSARTREGEEEKKSDYAFTI